jgi:hypothetical protein
MPKGNNKKATNGKSFPLNLAPTDFLVSAIDIS